MRSVIFSAMARAFFWIMLAVSVLILLRGHDQPGGGFVGGLVAAMAIGVVALADGVAAARRRLVAQPVVLLGLGGLLTIVSGIPGFVAGAAAASFCGASDASASRFCAAIRASSGSTDRKRHTP